MGKDCKSCESGKIGHFKSFWATSVGKDWKSCELGKIGYSKSFGGTLVVHFCQLSLLRLLSQSSEVEHNPKMSISIFDDLGGLFCILVNFHCSDRSANHQKLNVIQK